VGLRWELEIPFDEIDSFRRVSAIEDKPRGTLNLVALGDALFEIKTRTPVEARGAYGMRKAVSSVWFVIDEPEVFDRQLRERISAST
jgi:hypothetical protein